MKHYILNVNQNQQSKGYQLVDNLYFLAIHWGKQWSYYMLWVTTNIINIYSITMIILGQYNQIRLLKLLE